MRPSPIQRLASLKLEQDVVTWAINRRNGSDPKPSFRSIARDLEDATGVSVTDETIRLWVGSRAETAA